jgi:hypothetical protein
VALFFDDGSGAKVMRWPVDFSTLLDSTDKITPGSTSAVPVSSSMEMMRAMCREKSMTSPGPTALPAIEVPPPRGTTGVPVSLQAFRAATTSATFRGNSTASGGTL